MLLQLPPPNKGLTTLVTDMHSKSNLAGVFLGATENKVPLAYTFTFLHPSFECTIVKWSSLSGLTVGSL